MTKNLLALAAVIAAVSAVTLFLAAREITEYAYGSMVALGGADDD